MNSLKDKIRPMEREKIVNALKASNWVMAKAARMPGTTESRHLLHNRTSLLMKGVLTFKQGIVSQACQYIQSHTDREARNIIPTR